MSIYLSNFIPSNIGYVIKYKGFLYEAIALKNTTKWKGEYTMQRLYIALFNIWSTDFCKNSICSVCKKSNTDSFI